MIQVTTVVLPSWSQCSAKKDAKEEMTALEDFIYDNEPAGACAARWRALLSDVLAESINDDRIERPILI